MTAVARRRIVAGIAGMLLLVGCSLLGCGGVVGGVAGQAAANPGVCAPGSQPLGKTYGDWTALWYRWALGVPAAQSPLLDTTGDRAAVGQSGPVWFLAGTAGDPPIAERVCTVPAGKTILYPIVNVVGVVGVDAPTDGEVLRGTQLWVNYVSELETTVDGVELQGLWNYRFATGFFDLTVPADGIWPQYAGTHRAYAEGYWIMLEPLPPGPHEVHFRGKFSFPGSYPDVLTFETAVTYYLTVQ